MGRHDVRPLVDPDEMRSFTTRLLADVNALDRIIREGVIESGVKRIGAEQEVFLVDAAMEPAPISPAVMRDNQEPRLTTEFGAFNLEINADPLPLGGGCLRTMEQQLSGVVGSLADVVARHEASVVLCGILPTLRPADLAIANMTPGQRYAALDLALNELRGEDYRIYIKGVDELLVGHASTMLEACNTSFQLHLQVDTEDFAPLYNASIVAVAPLLAAATNSPLLFGRRLWRETRIALFQQSVDTRRAGPGAREFAPRVHFGHDWVDASPIELFRDDVARFRVLLGADSDEDSLAMLDRGDVPRLDALQSFNSTVYRWVRPCYGVAGGVPHLRIENRVLPSGPTITDEIANAAFWYGLVRGLVGRYGDVREFIQFDQAHGNFVAAARHGLGAPFCWLEGREVGARRLILDELLEVAAVGLDRLGIDPTDRDHYLGIIESRVSTRRTGSAWTLHAYEAFGGRDRGMSTLREVTAEMLRNARQGPPVHEWPRARPGSGETKFGTPARVDEMMSTDLLTVYEADPIELAVSLMRWRHVRHIPVEDGNRRLVGLVTRGDLFRYLADDHPGEKLKRPVADAMCRELVTVPPHTPPSSALGLMEERGLSALPVVQDAQLVGLVTERDFLGLAATLAGRAEPHGDSDDVPAPSW